MHHDRDDVGVCFGASRLKSPQFPFLGQIPLVQSIRESGDSGLPVVMKDGPAAKSFTDLAEALARQIAIRNANFALTKKVEITV